MIWMMLSLLLQIAVDIDKIKTQGKIVVGFICENY